MKKISKIVAMLFSVAFVMLVLGCSPGATQETTPTPNPTPSTATVAVTGVSLDRSNLTLAVGKTAKLIATVEPEDATDKTVIWSSEDNEIAEVSDEGTVTAKKAGTTKIKVKTNDGNFEEVCNAEVIEPISVSNIKLNKTSILLAVGKTEKLIATVEPENASDKTVIWSSEDNEIAEVLDDGTVTAKKAGTTKIKVKTNDGNFEKECNVEVTEPVSVSNIKLNKTSIFLAVGKTEKLIATVKPENATDKTVIWSSENNEIAEVSDNGTVTAKKTGTTKIKVKPNDGNFERICTVNVYVPVTAIKLNKTELTLGINESEKLEVTFEPSNATVKWLSWKSGDENIAEVLDDGTVTAKSVGQQTNIRVTAYYGDNTTISAYCLVKVKSIVTGVTLNRTQLTLTRYGQERLIATVEPANAPNKELVWTTNDYRILEVDETGLVHAKNDGSAKITATTVDGKKTATCIVTVKTAENLSTVGTYTELPNTTDGTAGTNGTYVTFGTYPQTIKSNNVTIDEIEANKMVRGMFTYYMGSDGAWYCKIRENAAGGGEDYKYSDGTKVAMHNENSYKWFKVEPIKWRVLTDNSGRKLLFCESGIHGGLCYYFNSESRKIDTDTIYPNNYMHSAIRAYLNGLVWNDRGTENNEYLDKGFIHTALFEVFTKITPTDIDNSVDSTGYNSNPYVCNNTIDKIFLLSYKEVTNSSYGFTDDTKRKRCPTDFALASGATKAYGAGRYFLRSPYYFEDYSVRWVATGSSGSGWVSPVGRIVYSTGEVIVPALWVKLN